MIIASPHDDQRRSSHGGDFFFLFLGLGVGGVDPACARLGPERGKLRPVFCSSLNFFSCFEGSG